MQNHTLPLSCAFLTRRSVARLSLGLVLGGITAVAAARAQRGDGNGHWVATWSTTLHAPELLPGFTNAGFNNQTLRQVVHIGIGGQRVRVRFSTFGADALAVDAARIALSAGDSTIIAASDRALTFGGKPSIVIPPGAPCGK